MLALMDVYVGGWNVMFIVICECISVCYVYGIRRFLRDIETMIGQNVCGFFPFVICKYWFGLMWCLIAPGGFLVSRYPLLDYFIFICLHIHDGLFQCMFVVIKHLRKSVECSN